jgi:hypothetical protein
LGNQNQAWNAFISNLNVLGLYPVVPSSQMPDFSSSSSIAIFDITLTMNVSFSSMAITPGIVMFVIRQNSVGGWSFVWPSNVLGGTIPGTDPNQVTVQTFVYDGTNAYNIGAAGVYP